MKTWILPVVTTTLLLLVGFFGSPYLTQWISSYLGIKFAALAPAEIGFPRTSLLYLLATCAVSAALVFWLYVRWYRQSALRVYFGVLAATLLLALAGVWLNLYQLQATFAGQAPHTHRLLDVDGLTYFEWAAWPIIVITVIALILLFFLQPGDPDEAQDQDTENTNPTENTGQS